jgi:hypothetical protein
VSTHVARPLTVHVARPAVVQAHAPSTHVCPSVQRMPHVPQLRASVRRSVQAPLQVEPDKPHPLPHPPVPAVRGTRVMSPMSRQVDGVDAIPVAPEMDRVTDTPEVDAAAIA